MMVCTIYTGSQTIQYYLPSHNFLFLKLNIMLNVIVDGEVDGGKANDTP